MHISGRGFVKVDDGIILIHRCKKLEDGNVKDYYVVPGGKQEAGEQIEDTVVREIEEEIGIKTKILKKIIEFKSEYDDSIQNFYICQYISGKIGTGNGPEFSDKVNYRGTYNIEVVKIDKIKEINLVPNEIKNTIMEELEKYYAQL